jgi:hypothetical protein
MVAFILFSFDDCEVVLDVVNVYMPATSAFDIDLYSVEVVWWFNDCDSAS